MREMRGSPAGPWVIGLTLALGWLVVGAPPASAQVDRGTIQGRVTDQTGAVVQDAKVEVIQLGTGTVTPVSSNSEGLYTAPNLPSGMYQVVISKEGFAPAVGDGVDIRAGVQIRLDMVLQPAGVAETVSVQASNLDSSAITNSTALSEKLVKDLPVIVSGTKRDITSLLQNLPGFTGGGTFAPRANGANVGDTEVFVDGGRAAQLINRGAFTEVGPSIEQVGEFSVVSNGFNAEYGGFGIWFSNVTRLRPKLPGLLVWRFRSAARIGVLRQSENAGQSVMGVVLQRDGQSDVGHRAGLHQHADVFIGRQLHPGIQLGTRGVPAVVPQFAVRRSIVRKRPGRALYHP